MIRFSKPTIIRKDMDAVLQTLVDEKIDPGEKVKEFTSCFSDLLNAQKTYAFRTMTDCISAAYDLAGKGKVGLSALAPEIYKDIALNKGMEVQTFDINPTTGCVDEKIVKDSDINILVISEPFSCLPVFYDDNTLSVEKIDYGEIFIIEDISQSFGSSIENIKPGDWGNLIICSVEQDTLVPTGGGAMLSLKNKSTYINMDYKELADLNASLGLIQLKSLNKRIETRQNIWKEYLKAAGKTKNKCLTTTLSSFECNGLGFCLRINSRTDLVIKFAMKYDIPVVQPFEKCAGKTNFDLYPNATGYIIRGVQFPLYPFLLPEEIDKIVKVIRYLP